MNSHPEGKSRSDLGRGLVVNDPPTRSAFNADRSEWLKWGQGAEGAADLSLMDSAPLSSWSGPAAEPYAAFVDESACIGQGGY